MSGGKSGGGQHLKMGLGPIQPALSPVLDMGGHTVHCGTEGKPSEANAGCAEGAREWNPPPPQTSP